MREALWDKLIIALRLLRDQADKAGWGLEQPAEWMRPMEYGK